MLPHDEGASDPQNPSSSAREPGNAAEQLQARLKQLLEPVTTAPTPTNVACKRDRTNTKECDVGYIFASRT